MLHLIKRIKAYFVSLREARIKEYSSRSLEEREYMHYSALQDIKRAVCSVDFSFMLISVLFFVYVIVRIGGIYVG